MRSNENRLLILGTQVLFGFQFNAVFQEMFESWPVVERGLACAGLALLSYAVGLLILPSVQHRIVERGHDNPGVLTLAAGDPHSCR